MAKNTEIQSALNDFVLGIDELEELEDELSRFNFFDAIKTSHQEIRHSNFLSWLLDPEGSHGLSDLFVKRFLQKVVYDAQTKQPVNPIDFDEWDLSDVTIGRESSNEDDRKRLDLLIVSKRHRLAALVENKIKSGEGAGQLNWYRQRMERDFKNFRRLCIFLTIDGDDPSDESYLVVSYKEVANILDGILDRRKGRLGIETELFIRHYVQMLRRHFVPDSNLAKLAQRIYRKHKTALDYLYEHKPDIRSELRSLLEQYLKQKNWIRLDEGSKAYIRFADSDWDAFPSLKEGKGWTGTSRILLFEVLNLERRLRLVLIIGPGPESTRSKLYEAFRKTPKFKATKPKMSGRHTRVWSETLLGDYDPDEDASDVFDLVKPKIESALSNLRPIVTKVVGSALNSKRRVG